MNPSTFAKWAKGYRQTFPDRRAVEQGPVITAVEEQVITDHLERITFGDEWAARLPARPPRGSSAVAWPGRQAGGWAAW